MNQIEIRTMVTADVEQVAQLEKEVFSMPWSPQGFLDALKNPANIFLVAEEMGDNPRVLGYCGLYEAAGEGEITNVAVEPAFRKAGIGKLLMQELLGRTKEAGICPIFLEVRVSNEPAIALYQKMGFQTAGVRKGFYEFPKEDAYVMIYNQ